MDHNEFVDWHLYRDVFLGSDLPAQFHHSLHSIDRFLDPFVARMKWNGCWILAEMHTNWELLLIGRCDSLSQISVHLLGQERCKWTHHFAKC